MDISNTDPTLMSTGALDNPTSLRRLSGLRRSLKLAAYLVAAAAFTGCSQALVADPAAKPVALTPGMSEAVEKGVRESLKDPDSARFGVKLAAIDGKGSTIVCGMVNAKNSYGGFTGEQPYYGLLTEFGNASKSVQIFSTVAVGGDSYKIQAIRQMCRRIGITI